MVLHHEGFPIRKSAGHSLFPTHRGLSQVITSFIGSQCQGIHLTLFFAWTAVLLFSILSYDKLKQIQLFCLSFANNCILWVVRSKKTMIFRSYDFVLSASRFLSKPTKLFPLLLYGKTYTFNNKFFSITTICFVSFLYSVFNEHLPFHSSLLPFTYFHKRKWIVKSEEVISEFPFAFAYENSGRPKWTRTTDLVLIRHAL